MKRLIMIVAAVALLAWSGTAVAAGECGLSCCIAGAVGEGTTLADNFGLTMKYEYMYMESIRKGTGAISPDEAIAANQQPGMSYKVPTEMVMQRYTIVGARPIGERSALLFSIPYVVNDMEMRSRSAMGMTMDMRMRRVSGLGDVTLMLLHTLREDAPVRPTERLTIGIGLKTPTGSASEKGSNGSYVHAMMQPGTGSWDPMVMVNYMRGFYPFVAQADLLYQYTTEGGSGYEFGDRFTWDLSAVHQTRPYLNLGLMLSGVHTGRDSDAEGRYSKPLVSMVDDTGNTGLDSVLVSPLVQVKIPGAGASARLKADFPVYQNVNGYQQVLDWRVTGSLTWAF